MAPDLVDWNKTMVPHLGKIERCAEMVSYYADQILKAAERIPTMPTFETRAEFELHHAMNKLHQAREILMKKERRD